MLSIPHIMIVESRFYPDVADELTSAAIAQIEAANGGTYKRVMVPTMFEIPVAIRYAIRAVEMFPARKRFDGYMALGCYIKDKGRSDIVSGPCTHALMSLSAPNFRWRWALVLPPSIAAKMPGIAQRPRAPISADARPGPALT